MPIQIRDLMKEPFTMDYVRRRTEEGWIVAAVEWVKPALDQAEVRSTLSLEDIPYGQRISADCRHLVDDDREMDVLLFMYERVVAGWRPAKIAAELNSLGHRTRGGLQWTPNAVFDSLPRLIELSPRLQKRPDWPSRKRLVETIG